MGEDNISTVRGLYETFAKGDFASLPFDPQIEWNEPEVEGVPGGGTHRGPEAVIKEVFEPVLDKVDDFRLECDQFIDAGDHVIVTGRFLGRGKETRNELNASFAHIWALRDGKVVQFQCHSDTANWLRALHHVRLEEPMPAHR